MGLVTSAIVSDLPSDLPDQLVMSDVRLCAQTEL